MSTGMISCVPTREASITSFSTGEAGVIVAPHSSGDSRALTVRARPVTTRSAEDVRRGRRAPLRRLRGFLLETQGTECTVLFVDSGHSYQYHLPANQLHKAGVKAPNQPFEMDEVEIAGPDGEPGLGYIFRAAARPKDAFADRVVLDAERQSKLDMIRKKLGHAQA